MKIIASVKETSENQSILLDITIKFRRVTELHSNGKKQTEEKADWAASSVRPSNSYAIHYV